MGLVSKLIERDGRVTPNCAATAKGTATAKHRWVSVDTGKYDSGRAQWRLCFEGGQSGQGLFT